MILNRHGVAAIYGFEMARFGAHCGRAWRRRSHHLFYFVVQRRHRHHMTRSTAAHGAFIVPGLIMLALFTEASRMPRSESICAFHRHGIRVLSAPVSARWCSPTSARPRPSILLGLIIRRPPICSSGYRPPAVDDRLPRADGDGFLPVRFILGLWADGFDQLQFIPCWSSAATFLGGLLDRQLPPA
jgi:ABC-2 type transport system permease protein